MKTVLITGANRGLGLGLVKEFLQDGWRVYAACRHPDQAQELKQLTNAYDAQLNLLKLDVREEQDIHQLAKDFADISLDILINNAGVMVDPHDRSFSSQIGDVKAYYLMESFKVNATGPLLLTQALLPSLIKSTNPIVVNMSSNLGSISHNHVGGVYGYRASKAALNAISKNMAVELKEKNIAVVALHPGWVKTDMGGPAATLTLAESVKPMQQLISNISMKDSGKFLDYKGEELEW
ncbi:MAG TPA: SDR family oxidoreductase [Gammaproteobacteria bacterium]|nr:SDR family oxidoreductase [Gammaproteobacteria bacterium]